MTMEVKMETALATETEIIQHARRKDGFGGFSDAQMIQILGTEYRKKYVDDLCGGRILKMLAHLDCADEDRPIMDHTPRGDLIVRGKREIVNIVFELVRMRAWELHSVDAAIPSPLPHSSRFAMRPS